MRELPAKIYKSVNSSRISGMYKTAIFFALAFVLHVSLAESLYHYDSDSKVLVESVPESFPHQSNSEKNGKAEIIPDILGSAKENSYLTDVSVVWAILILIVLSFIVVAIWHYRRMNHVIEMLHRNISKRYEVELGIRESESRLEEAQRIAHIGSWELDLITNKLTWSAEIHNIFEMDMEGFEVTYEDFLSVIHPADKDNVKQAYSDSLKNKTPYMIEHRLLMRDGRVKYVRENCKTEYDDNGIPIRSVGTVQDISDSKKSELKLTKSQEHYRSLVESTAAIPWELDLDTWRFTYVGPQVVNILGYPITDWYQDDFWPNHLHPDDKDKSISFCKSAAASGEDHEFEYRMLNADGKTAWIRDYAKVISEHGIPKRLQGFMFDITEQRKKEEQLHRAQKMDALGKLTGGIAHDYNNMLGVIMGYAELLEMNLANEPRLLKYSKEIYQAGERGRALTKKLLTFSKGRSEQARPVNINTVILDDQNMLQKVLTSRIELRFNLEEMLWQTSLDKGELEDVLINMSINAMHAMQDGGSLTLETENKHLTTDEAKKINLESGDYILLSVIDTGTGIDEDIQYQIFEPFFSTKGDEGTGMGLSQVSGFVKQLGGTVSVNSQPGHGTQLTLYFPRHNGDNGKLDESSDDAMSQLQSRNLEGNETILVVDDEDSLGKLAEKVLAKHGYKVFRAQNGLQALEMLEDEPATLILSDVIMPGMNGYQLAEKIRKRFPDTKIQLVSGFDNIRCYTDQDTKLRHNLLVKPFTSKELLKKVRELLDGEYDE